MLIYNLTKERLVESGFIPLMFDWSAELGVISYQREHIYTFLKNYEYRIAVDTIINDVIELRRRLERSDNVNVWNSYILICTDESINTSVNFLMKVERDTTAIRKYLIRNVEDLNRIPFLDATRSSTLKLKNIISEELLNDLEDIKDLVGHIHELTFQGNGKVTSQKIKKEIEEKYIKGVSCDED